MAMKIIRVLIDDIDGSDADETVSFRIDGVDYEIDLSAEKAAELRLALEPYISAGRKTGRRITRSARSKQPTRPAPDAASIREWASRNGYTTQSRGRIPADIMEAHEKATA